MKKNILLGALFTIVTSAVGSEMLSLQEHLRSSIQEDPKIIAYMKDILTVPNQDQVMAEIISPHITYQNLDFKKVNNQIFNNNYWIPQHTTFTNSRIEKLLSAYQPQTRDISDYHIFLANLLYAAGNQYYKQTKNPEFIEYAASIGHAKAQNVMFSIKVRTQKFSEAKNYLMSAAAQKNPEALFSLSRAYLGVWKLNLPKDIEMSKMLCQESAYLGHHMAQFRIEVAPLTEGYFDSEINYQKGIRKAKELADQGNERAIEFIDAIMRSSGDALMEGNDTITYEDLDFLKEYLGWQGEDNDAFSENE